MVRYIDFTFTPDTGYRSMKHPPLTSKAINYECYLGPFLSLFFCSSYDRTLGGLDLQIKLRDFLANEFNSLKKTKTDVKTIPRSMAKLFNEAGKVKNVLSANMAIKAQVSCKAITSLFVTSLDKKSWRAWDWHCESLLSKAAILPLPLPDYKLIAC